MKENSVGKIFHPVFVILPIRNTKHADRVFAAGIVPALAQLGFEARRIDAQAITGGIVPAIQEQIVQSYFVIADLSFARPNCYYEFGYAEALGKPVMLIKDSRTKAHFDLAHQMVHDLRPRQSARELILRLVPEFLVTHRREPGDNLNGEFGRKCIRNGYRLTARILESTSSSCYVDLEVAPVHPRRSLTSPVKFYMHESYKKSAQTMRVRNGVARYEEVESSAGPWTVGAEVLSSGTRLELDLATIPGAHRTWYRKAYKLRPHSGVRA